MKRNYDSRGLRVWLTLLTVMAVTAPVAAADGKPPKELLSVGEISGGVVVCLGAADGSRLERHRYGDNILVQGLELDGTKVDETRQYLASRKLSGPVTVRQFDGRHLPYIDNMVNQVVVYDAFEVSDEEILRVLAPGGKAAFVDLPGGVRKRLAKPQPDETDEWTHYLYDAGGNAVSHDTRVDSIERQQWVGGPRWSRHHDHIASLTAMVSTGGRVFYVFDEGKTASVLLPSSHVLIARDAYNGTVLWKKPLPSWHPHLWPLKSGPAHLPRRLVAVDGKVYLPLGMNEPLSVVDAETGVTLNTFEETGPVEEVLVADGMICVLSNPTPPTYEEFDLGDAHNGSQKGRVAKEYPWNKAAKNVVVIDEETGKVRWKQEAAAAPLTLTVGAKNVLYFDGSKIVALDKADGRELWASDDIKVKKAFAIAESPILVAYENYVLFAGANELMSSYNADTGRRLWETEHLRGGYCSPQDLFVIDGTVWSGAIASPRQNGQFVGRDVETGEVRRDVPENADVPYTFGHHRCHRAKATTRFILASKTGIEFYDIENQSEEVNHWVRGGCLYGIMPANGLIYSPMHSCACHLDSKLTGFNALAPAANAKTETTDSPRLVKGEAYSRKGDGSADWPTYRADIARSGATAAPVADGLRRKWKAPFDGKLSALTVGCGKVFVAAVDEHRLYALDQNSGEEAWSFMAGSRIDSPPTVYRGFVYFGSADGHIYSVAAADGKLAWRFRLAPDDSQLCSYGQLESVWPVNGSVTIKDEKLFAVGGRSSFLDGGLPFVRLDAATGKLEAASTLDDFDPASGGSMQLLSDKSIMPSAIPDILSSDGENFFMRVEKLSPDGRRIGSFEFDEERQYEDRHIFSWAGFLDDSWLHRIYMSFGNGKIPLGTYLNWWTYGEYNPDGRSLVMDDSTIYSYGLKPKYHTWSSTFNDYQLFSVNKKIETVPITGPTIFDRNTGRTPEQHLKYNWTAEVPFYVRAMIKASDKLIVCGPEKIIDEKGVVPRWPGASVLEELKEQDAILDGSRGSRLWVVDARSGQILEKHELSTLPVWDGMAAAARCVYLATQDGVECFGGE